MDKKVFFAGFEVKNQLIASSSPLTETARRVRCCYEADFGGVILKSAADYSRTGEGYGRKVVFLGDDFFADASFEREILTAQEGVELYKEVSGLEKEMLIIPSVTAASENVQDWLHICRIFEAAGARLLQLDFFYLGTVIRKKDKGFYQRLGNLLADLQNNLKCIIMPKLNFNFDPESVCGTLAESGIKQVSLLDSIRFALPERFGLHPATTSYFGSGQLPLTLDYLHHAVKAGLEVCAGGGVSTAADVDILMENGAKLVQTASYVLKNGFGSGPVLLHRKPAALKTAGRTWCDAECYGAKGCERCGFCCSYAVGNKTVLL